MTKKLKKIAVLTSGGDAPGMNAAVRAVVRSSVYNNIECYGVYKGFEGLISDDLVKMLNISFDFAEKLKISTIDLYDDRNPTIEIPVWEEFGNNIKNKIEYFFWRILILDERIKQ